MKRLTILALAGLSVVGLSACGQGGNHVAPVTSTVPGKPVATFSASTFVLPGSSQSPKATSAIPSPTDTEESAPPPTVVTPSPSTVTISASAAPSAGQPTPSSSSTQTTKAAPAAFSVAKISLATSLVPLDAVGGNITPPHGKLSWYTSSAKPGQAGTAVIMGYRSDVLAKMSSLSKGDIIQSAGASYRVTSTKRESVSAMQSDRALWSATKSKQLALVAIDGGTVDIVMAVAP